MNIPESVEQANQYINDFEYSIEYCDSSLSNAFDLVATVHDKISRSYLDYFIRIAKENNSTKPMILNTDNSRIKKLFVAVAIVHNFYVNVNKFTGVPDIIQYRDMRYAKHLPLNEVAMMKTQMLFLRMKDE